MELARLENINFMKGKGLINKATASKKNLIR